MHHLNHIGVVVVPAGFVVAVAGRIHLHILHLVSYQPGQYAVGMRLDPRSYPFPAFLQTLDGLVRYLAVVVPIVEFAFAIVPS